MTDQQAHFPELSPADRDLFTLFLEAGEDLRALAARSGKPLLDLLAWAVRPETRRALTAWDSMQRRARQARDDADRALAREALKAAMADSPDPIEKRRAAAALLRSLSPPAWDLHRRPARRLRVPAPNRPPDEVAAALRVLRESEATLARAHRACTVPPVPPPPARPSIPQPRPAPPPPRPAASASPSTKEPLSRSTAPHELPSVPLHLSNPEADPEAPRTALVSDLLTSTRSPLALLNLVGAAAGPTRSPRPP